MGNLWQDIQYSIRMLVKHLGFTVVAALTLAFGIGANTAIFSVVNTVLLRPLPVSEPEQLVAPTSTILSYPAYLDFRERNRVFDGLAANDTLGRKLRFTRGDATEFIAGEGVSGNYFSVLGVEMQSGRGFLPDEGDAAGGQPVAVINYNLWQRSFEGRPDILGQTITLNGQALTIVGVAPRGFHGTRLNRSVDVWFPLANHPRLAVGGETGLDLNDRDSQWIRVTGRLKPNMGADQALAEMNAIGRQLNAEYPNTDQWEFKELAPALSLMVGGRRDEMVTFVWMLIGAVGFALLIACANVANLLLVRAEGRRKEIGVRLALGAGRFRLVRQLLTESLMLSFIGGAAGLLVALWALDILRAFELPGRVEIESLHLGLDNRVLGFSLLLSVVTGLLFGLVPALASSRQDIAGVLKGAHPGQPSGNRWIRGSFVVAQVAISVVLLVGGGLFVRSLQNALAVDTGFDGSKVALAAVDLDAQGYAESQAENFYKQAIERVRALPGVESATWANYVPVQSRAYMEDFAVEGYQPQPGEETSVLMNHVWTDYFRTLGIQIVSGRDFNERDISGAPGVAIVNESWAKRFWPGQDPIGRRIRIGGQKSWTEIAGVVKDSKYRSLTEDPQPYIYVPMTQHLEEVGLRELKIVARAEGDPAALVGSLRKVLQDVDPQIAVSGAMTWKEHLGDLVRSQEMGATLMGFFSLLALLLTAVGIYGVISYSIGQRTHEIGVRMALGAGRRDILKLVVGQGMTLAAIGTALGLGAAFALTRYLSSLLFGIEPTDPATFAIVAVLLSIVSLLACYLPARRAAKVDPMEALRYE